MATREQGFPIGGSVTLAALEADPHPGLAQLRRQEPVSWLPALGGWLVTRRDLAVEVMRDASSFTVDDPRFSTAQVVGPSMLSLDGGEHERHRRAFAAPFRHAEVEARFARFVAAEADRLVTGLQSLGVAELRTGLAGPLAASVVAYVLGLKRTDPAELLDWYASIVAAVNAITAGGPVPSSGPEAFRRLRAAVERTIASSSDALLTEVVAGGELAVPEVISNAAVLMFGGIETSEGMTSNLLFRLLNHPDQLTLIRVDRSLLPNAIEESLRLEPAAAVVDRYATRDVDLAGASIKRGDLVTVSLAGANRDPAVFPEPDRFDVGRANARQHLAFAHGPHVCLGLHLARLETLRAAEAVLDRLRDIRLAEGSSPPSGLIFRKPSAVKARWEPGLS
jgi:cytochrome P450